MKRPHIEYTEPRTVRDVNKALQELGVPEKLVKGKGYYFFFGGTTDAWPVTRIDVASIEQLSVQDWVKQYHHLRSMYMNHMIQYQGPTTQE